MLECTRVLLIHVKMKQVLDAIRTVLSRSMRIGFVELWGQQIEFVLCKGSEFYHNTGSLCEEASELLGNDRAMLRFHLFLEALIGYQ